MTYDVGNPVPGLGQADYVGIRKMFVQISLVLEKQEVLFKMCDPVLKLEPLVKMYSPAAES